jgi:hypothetical protein
MKLRVVVTMFLELSLVIGPVCAQTFPYERAEQSTVRILASHGENGASGTGFVIGDGHFVATNHHVIADADELWVYAKLLKSRVIRVVADSPEKDLAILELDNTTGRAPVRFGLRVGVHPTEPVLAAGFPGAADAQAETKDNLLEVKFTQGIISGYVQGSRGQALYQISAPLNPGNSGGPLFDQCGRVIGINVEKSLTKAVVIGADGNPTTERVPLGEGIAWSIQADELVDLLRSKNIPVNAESNACVPGAAVDGSDVTSVGTRNPVVQAMNTQGASAGAGDNRWVWLLSSVGLLLLASVPVVIWRRLQGALGGSHSRVGVSPNPFSGSPYLPSGMQSAMKLICISGTHAGMEFPISHEALRLGRDRSWSQIVFNETDRLVSRRHCSVRLDLQNGGFVLEDCDSSHGTFLDSGERLKSNVPRVLMPNSRFYVGSRANTFQVQ